MKVISTDKAPAAIGPYSQAIVSGGMVYTSGQIAIDPATGAVVSGGIEEQTEQVCRNIEQLLKAAGTDIGRVVKTVCFLATPSTKSTSSPSPRARASRSRRYPRTCWSRSTQSPKCESRGRRSGLVYCRPQVVACGRFF